MKRIVSFAMFVAEAFSCTGSGALSSDIGGLDVQERTVESARTSIGFFYVPQRAAGTWLLNDFTSGAGFPGTPPSLDVQTQLRRDLVTMAAMGAKTLKIGYESSSDVPSQGLSYPGPLTYVQKGGALRNDANLRRSIENLKAVILQAANLGMTVEIDFLINSAIQLRGPNGFYPASNPTWFEWSYASLAGGDQRMADDLAWWVSETITELERTVGRVVRTYYLVIEATYEPRFASLTSVVTRKVAASAPVSDEKLGFTVAPFASLTADYASKQRDDIVASGRWLGTTGLNSYPAAGINPISTWPETRSTLDAIFGGTRKVIGEFGVEFCDIGRNESLQAQMLHEGLEVASRLGFSQLINWGLWDYGPNPANCGSKWGLGFSADAPRDSYGIMSDWGSSLRGGDFEVNAGGFTSGAPSGASTLRRMGPYNFDAATNDYFLRHESTESVSWVCSAAFPVSGAALAIAGYLRATGAVTLAVHTKTGAGWSYAVNASIPTLRLPSGPWAWRQIQSLADGKTLPLPAGATEAIVCFVSDRGTSSGGVTYVDLDAIAAAGVPGQSTHSLPATQQCGAANPAQRGLCHPSTSGVRCASDQGSPTGFSWQPDASCRTDPPRPGWWRAALGLYYFDGRWTCRARAGLNPQPVQGNHEPKTRYEEMFECQ